MHLGKGMPCPRPSLVGTPSMTHTDSGHTDGLIVGTPCGLQLQNPEFTLLNHGRITTAQNCQPSGSDSVNTGKAVLPGI